jgi:hypothetical protein
MASLSRATRAAVDSLQGKLEVVVSEFKEYRVTQDAKLQALIDSNERLTLAILRLVNPVDDGGNGVLPPPPPPQPGNPNNQPAPRRSDGDDDVEGDAEEEEEKQEEQEEQEEDENGGSQETAAAATPAGHQPAVSQGQLVEAQFRLQANRDATSVIQGMALQPPLKNKKCPGTWSTCLQNWQGNNLQYWESKSKAGWDKDVVRAFNKRLSIHREMVRFRTLENEEGDATAPICTMEIAARLLDELRGQSNLNLTDHLNQRQKENPSVRSRTGGRGGRNRRLPSPPQARTPREATQQHPPFDGTEDRQRRSRGGRATQQQRPPVEDDVTGDAFGAEFNPQPSAAAIERDRVRQQQTNLLMAQEQAAFTVERERRRTSGSLMYRVNRGVDRRNHGDMSRYGRDAYRDNHLGPG